MGKQDYLNHLSLKLKCDKVVITSMRASPPGEPKAVYVEVQAAGFPEGQGQAQEAVEKIQAGSAVDADANGSRWKEHRVTTEPRLSTMPPASATLNEEPTEAVDPQAEALPADGDGGGFWSAFGTGDRTCGDKRFCS